MAIIISWILVHTGQIISYKLKTFLISPCTFAQTPQIGPFGENLVPPLHGTRGNQRSVSLFSGSHSMMHKLHIPHIWQRRAMYASGLSKPEGGSGGAAILDDRPVCLSLRIKSLRTVKLVTSKWISTCTHACSYGRSCACTRTCACSCVCSFLDVHF